MKHKFLNEQFSDFTIHPSAFGVGLALIAEVEFKGGIGDFSVEEVKYKIKRPHMEEDVTEIIDSLLALFSIGDDSELRQQFIEMHDAEASKAQGPDHDRSERDGDVKYRPTTF